MKIRTQLRAGGEHLNHSETFRVRTALKAGHNGQNLNHSETIRVRTALRAGGIIANHTEPLRRR